MDQHMSAITSALPVRSVRARTAWTSTGVILAILLIVALALSTSQDIAYVAIPPSQRSFSQTLSAIDIHLYNGSVTIEHASGRETVVESSGSRGFARPTNVERVLGHTLSITSTCAFHFVNFCTRNYVVHVPTSVPITVATGQGSVTVARINGPVSINTGQGDVTVLGARGSATVTTGQGNVTMRDITAPRVNASSGQGDVAIDVLSPPTSLTTSTAQGSIDIELPRGADSYRVRETSAQGSVNDYVDESPTSFRVIHASSGQGDVTIRYAPK
jgi:hypothetical protein